MHIRPGGQWGISAKFVAVNPKINLVLKTKFSLLKNAGSLLCLPLLILTEIVSNFRYVIILQNTS